MCSSYALAGKGKQTCLSFSSRQPSSHHGVLMEDLPFGLPPESKPFAAKCYCGGRKQFYARHEHQPARPNLSSCRGVKGVLSQSSASNDIVDDIVDGDYGDGGIFCVLHPQEGRPTKVTFAKPIEFSPPNLPNAEDESLLGHIPVRTRMSDRSNGPSEILRIDRPCKGRMVDDGSKQLLASSSHRNFSLRYDLTSMADVPDKAVGALKECELGCVAIRPQLSQVSRYYTKIGDGPRKDGNTSQRIPETTSKQHQGKLRKAFGKVRSQEFVEMLEPTRSERSSIVQPQDGLEAMLKVQRRLETILLDKGVHSLLIEDIIRLSLRRDLFYYGPIRR